jgi:hypothetical protein
VTEFIQLVISIFWLGSLKFIFWNEFFSEMRRECSRKMQNGLRNKWQQEKIILIDDNDDLILVGERINSAEKKRERHEEIPERLERNENSCFVECFEERGARDEEE